MMSITTKEQLDNFIDQILRYWKKNINLFNRKRMSIHIDSIGFPFIITIRYAGLCEKKYIVNNQTVQEITFDFAKHYAHYRQKECSYD